MSHRGDRYSWWTPVAENSRGKVWPLILPEWAWEMWKADGKTAEELDQFARRGGLDGFEIWGSRGLVLVGPKLPE